MLRATGVDGRSTGPTTAAAVLATTGRGPSDAGPCAGGVLDVSEWPADKGGWGGLPPWLTATPMQVAPEAASSTVATARARCPSPSHGRPHVIEGSARRP